MLNSVEKLDSKQQEEFAECKENKTNKKNETKGSMKRFKEMLKVLRYHRVARGMSPKKLVNILEDMGPTYVKLGQIMSMRSDILPLEYCNELAKLRTDVSPLSFDEIEKVLQEEYDKPIYEIFKSIDKKPFGSASIAQVHKAVLLSTGEEVVIKVQRPGIHDIVQQDIILMKKASKVIGVLGSDDNPLDFNTIIDELWNTTQEEMDFTKECKNILKFKKLNEDINYISCPKVYEELSSNHVLVMECINGTQIDDIKSLNMRGYDMNEIGVKLAQNYCKQIIDDAFFHADPHPGNIWVRDGQIVFLDFGMMGSISVRDKNLFGKAMFAAVENDVTELKRITLALGVVNGNINHSKLYSDIDDMLCKYGDMGLSSINIGKMIEELLQVARSNNISMPEGITMLARGAVTIEGVLSYCAPEINIMTIIANHMSNKIRKETDSKKELLRFLKSSKSATESSIKIPSQLSNLLNMAIRGQSKLNLEIMGSDEPMSRIETMVNRIIICIIAAALLMSSSLIYTSNISNSYFGVPVLGTSGFIIAFLLSGGLLVSIVYKHHKRKK